MRAAHPMLFPFSLFAALSLLASPFGPESASGDEGKVKKSRFSSAPGLSEKGVGMEKVLAGDPDTWEGFQALSPEIQGNLRKIQNPVPTAPFDPNQPLNVRANDPSGDAFTNSAQTEVTVAAWGPNVLVSWFDTEGTGGVGIGYGYSCDYGQTFTDGGEPPIPVGGDQILQGMLAVDGAGSFYLAANYGPNGWTEDTHAVWRGTFSGCSFSWNPPVVATAIDNSHVALGDYLVQPRIAISPVDGRIFLTYAYYLGTGGSRVETVVSTDQGATWSAPVVLKSGGYDIQPDVAVGPDGEAYVAWSTSYLGDLWCDMSGVTGVKYVAVSKSTDGGATWSTPANVAAHDVIRLQTGPGDVRGWDYSSVSIAVDRTSGPGRGNVFIVWHETQDWTAPVQSGNSIAEVEPNDTPADALTIPAGDMATGNVTALGQTDYWRLSLTAGDNVVVRLDPGDLTCGSTGTANSFYMYLYSDPQNALELPVAILGRSAVSQWMPQLTFTANRTGDYYVRVIQWAGTPINYTLRTGLVSFVTPTATAPARDFSDIVAITSTDGGATWSDKVLVNYDAPAGYLETFPYLTVDGNGMVRMFWYDRRESESLPAVNAQWTDVYMASAPSDAFVGSISTGQRITDESATNSGTYRTLYSPGMYQGATSDGGHVYAGWADQRGSNASTSHFDAYTQMLDFEPPTVAFIEAPAESSTIDTGGVHLSWLGADRITPEASLEYATDLDGGGFSPYGSATDQDLASLTEGSHTFTVSSRDQVGNESSVSTTFTVDLTDPAVSFVTGPAEGAWVPSADVDFAWMGSDNLTALEDLLFASSLDGEPLVDGSETTRSLTGLSGGAHSFSVRVTDAAGRIAMVTRNFGVDTTAPSVEILTGPTDGSYVASADVSFDVQASDDLTPEMYLEYFYVLDAGPPVENGTTGSVSLSGLSEGPHSFSVQSRDLAGNESAAVVRNFTVDLSGPSVTFLTGPGDGSHVPSADVSFTVEGTDNFTPQNMLQYSYVLDGGLPVQNGPVTTIDLTGLAEGSHSFEVRSLDLAGNEGSTGPRTFTVDLTPPSVSVTSPADGAYLATSDVPVSILGSDNLTPLLSLEYAASVDGGAYSAYGPGSSFVLPGLAEGGHSLSVRCRDRAGNESTEATITFTVDVTVPTVAILSGPAEGSYVGFPDVSFTVDGSDNITAPGSLEFSYSVDGGLPVLNGAATTIDLTGLADGPHTVDVTSRDQAGNESAAASRSFTVDTDIPLVDFTLAPLEGATLPTTDVAFEWMGADAVTPPESLQYASSLDGEAFTAYSHDLSRNLAGLGEGPHALSVRTVDLAGNESAVIMRTFNVDVTPPTVAILTGPSEGTYVGTADITFSVEGTDNLASLAEIEYSWSLDGGAFSIYDPGTDIVLSALADGPHSFAVKAKDLAGNESSVQTRSFSVDLGDPAVAFVAGPSEGAYLAAPDVDFTWTGSDAVTPNDDLLYSSSLDGEPFAADGPDTSRSLVGLGDGAHTFAARVTDAVGHTGSVTRAFTVDTGPPSVSILTGPDDGGYSGSADVTFTVGGSDNLTPAGSLEFAVSVDAGPFSAYAAITSFDLTGLAEGGHSFGVKSRDLAGNESVELARSFTVDTTPPSASILTGPAEGSYVGSGDVGFTVEGSDNLSPPGSLQFSYSLDGGPPVSNGTGTAIDLTGLPEGPHTLAVRSLDLAGNESAEAARSFFVDLGDPSVSIVSGPGQGENVAAIDLDISWQGTDAVTPVADLLFASSLDGEPFTADGPDTSRSLSGLAEGTHSFSVRVTDAVGHTALVSRDFTVDVTPPSTALTGGPADGSFTLPDVMITFSGSDNLTPDPSLVFVYRLDGGSWSAPQSDPFVQLTGLAPGVHDFDVASVDLAGNTDPTPASIGFDVDAVGPETAFVTEPTGTLSSGSEPVEWTGSDDKTPVGSLVYSFRLDGNPFGAFGPDVSTALSGLADGPHTFEVKSRDLAGNEDGTPAAAAFTWDVLPPQILVTAGPAEGADVNVTDVMFEWQGSDVVSPPAALEFATSLDGGPLSVWGPETSISLTGLAESNHVLEIQARDEVGHVAILDRSFRVDLTPPQMQIPTAVVLDGAVVKFTFTAIDAGTIESFAIEISEDPDFAVPPTPIVLNSASPAVYNYSGLTGHTYYARARATDRAGNESILSQVSNGGAIASLPDLVVSNVQAPPTGFSRQNIQVGWTVNNPGPGDTNVPVWTDRIYLSPTPTFDAGTAMLLGSTGNLTVLPVGQSYVNTLDAQLPEVSGTYYALVVTDANEDQGEADGGNNVAASLAIDIQYSDHADLEPTEINVPISAFSGEPVSVNWTVLNNGTGRTEVSSWYDVLFLSPDPVLDYEIKGSNTIRVLDTYLGRVQHTGAVDPGNTYVGSGMVSLPPLASGSYYLFVWSDLDASYQSQVVGERGEVFESLSEFDNTLSGPIDITLTPPGDLVIDLASAPGSAMSGTGVTVSWQVGNPGNRDTYETNWTDRVYLSTDATFDAGDAPVALAGHTGVLAKNGSYGASATVALPPDLEGSYWLFVVADADDKVLELSDVNNVSTALPIDVTLSDWPDLVVTKVLVPSDPVGAGTAMAVSWRWDNTGAGSLPGTSWKDRIYVSTLPSFSPGSATYLGEVSVSMGSASLQSATVTLPAGLTAGAYYIHAVSDALGNVFENGLDGNNSASAPITVTAYPAVDLEISMLSTPAAAASGQTIQVSWKVTNLGAGATLAGAWPEDVYLSLDDVLSPSTDIRLDRSNHFGVLPGAGQYDRSRGVFIPHTLSGDYYLIVVTDPSLSTGDGNPGNNSIATAAAIPISLTPPPDLAVSGVSLSASSAESGQPLSISWTYENVGSGVPVPSGWYGAAYLSADPILDPYDLLLDSTPGAGALAGGGNQPGALDVYLPNFVSGPYYVIVKADSRNEVYEAGSEANNLGVVPIFITLAQIVDLEVTSVSGPTTGVPGDPVSVDWVLHNPGTTAAVGRIREAVYISQDPVFVAEDDPLVGVIDHVINLPAGSSIDMQQQVRLDETYQADLAGNITEVLPGVLPGDYYFIVRTNVRDDFRESDFSNNVAASVLTTSVDIPVLTPDVRMAFSFSEGQIRYFKIPTTSGFDLRVTADGDVAGATNEVYLAFGSTPNPSNFEYSGPATFTSSPHMLVPSTQDGYYYLMVLARNLPDGTPSENITLRASILDFQIESVTPDAGGSGGFVTCTVRGAGFRDSTQVRLEYSGVPATAADRVDFINTTELKVRWNLTGIPVASYDVVAVNGDVAASLPSSFMVQAALVQAMETSTEHDPVIRSTKPAVVTFRYANRGNWDVPHFRVRLFYPATASLEAIQGDGLLSASGLFPEAASLVADSYLARDPATGDSVRVLDLVSGDVVPPGGEIACTLSFKGFPTSRFSVRSVGEILDTEGFVAREASRIEAARQAILVAPTGSYPAEVVALAADPPSFRDAALTHTYVDAGILTAADVSMYGSSPAPPEEFPTSSPCGSDPLPDISECEPDVDAVTCTVPLCGCIEDSARVVLRLPWGVVESAYPADLCAGYPDGDLCAAIKVVRPCDPNLITGPTGYGDPAWIGSRVVANYVVDFENLSEVATAPAQVARIYVPLDPNLDLTSFRLGNFGFGIHVVNVPPNSLSFTDEQYYSDIGLRVRIVAGVDLTNHRAFWTFQSIDPATGNPPTDPYVGFLPVNDPFGRGQGFVNFSIQPQSGAVTGATVSAQGSITFDNNAPLVTNSVSNTIDAGIPTSAVVSSTPVDPTTQLLQWAGADPSGGSGLGSVSLYVREDSGPFQLFQGDLPGASIQFDGETGHVYGFYTLAVDHSGNVEVTKTDPDIEVGVGNSTGVDEGEPKPLRFLLMQNAPNPFRGATQIRFVLPQEERVDLRLYDVSGRLVRVLVDGEILSAGEHTFPLQSGPLGSGVYFYRLVAGRNTSTRKLLLLR